MNWGKFFEEQFPLIDSIIHKVAFRKVILGEDAEDFSSFVYEKLIENNYQRIQKFRGGESKTKWAGYITIVISRLALDYQKHHWHRFQHSKKALAMGEPVKRFEIFLYRDFLPLNVASKNLLEDPQCSQLFCISNRVLKTLPAEFPESLQKKLETIASETIFFEQKWNSLIDSLLIEQAELPFRDILKRCTAFNLTQSILDVWHQSLPKKIPPPKLVQPGDLFNEEGEYIADSLESVMDPNSVDPLRHLLNEELIHQLEEAIRRHIQKLPHEDWLILSLYLEKKITLTGIARMLGFFQDQKDSNPDIHQKVKAQAWERVKHCIATFETGLQIIFSQLKLDKEDRKEIAQEALSLVSKILGELQKKTKK